MTLAGSPRVYAQSVLDDDGFPQLNSVQSEELLQLFRQSRIPGNFFLKFNITHKPRFGENSRPIDGTLWASWANGGPLLRVEILDLEGKNWVSFVASKNPKKSTLWISKKLTAPLESNTHELNEPIVPGVIMSAFDINLPFTHWPQTRYLSTLRSRGRGVHFYESINPTAGEPAKVVYGIDRTYGVLTEAIYYDRTGKITRTLKIEDFCKINGQWMVGTCSLRDENTRDVDSLKITDAAMQINLLEQTFNPESLVEKAKAPEPSEIKSF